MKGKHNKTKYVLITKIANNKELESERSDVLILSRHHCPEVTTTEFGV